MDLFQVIANENTEKLTEQIKFGVDIHVKDLYGRTLLHIAASSGRVNVFVYLTKLDLDPYDVDKRGRNVLHEACVRGQYDTVTYICRKYPDLQNQVDFNKWTALHTCAYDGSVDIFKFLVRQGLDITSETTYGQNVLHIACLRGRYELVKHIVSEFPELKNKVSVNKWTALHYCCVGCSVDILKFLVSQGLDVTSITSLGENILHIASYYGRYELVKHIVAEFPDLKNKVDIYKQTALHFCAYFGNVDIFKFLIGQGLDVTCVSTHGSNVLHIACNNHGRYDLMRYIITTYPGMMAVTNTSGQIPLDLAFPFNHRQIISCLRQHRGKTSTLDPKARAWKHRSTATASIPMAPDVAIHQTRTQPTPPVSSVERSRSETASNKIFSDNCDQKVKVTCSNSPLSDGDRSANATNSVLMSSDGIADQDSTFASFFQSADEVADGVSVSATILQSSDEEHIENATAMEEQAPSLTDETIRMDCQACQQKATNKVNKASWYCRDCGNRLCDECNSNHEIFPPIKHHTIISLQPTCEVCNEGGCASWFCVKCRQYLCEGCRVRHSHMTETKQHRVISCRDYHSISRYKKSGSKACIVM